MATTKITDLTAYTDPVNTDVLPIVDVTSDVTKKVSIANVMKNASLGSASLPGVSFDGDPNTGIYSPGADQLALATGGSGRLFVDSSGNVGIGAAPDGQLSLLGANSNTPRFRIQHPSNDKDAAISTYFDGGGTYLLTGSNHYFSSTGVNTKFDATSGSSAWYLDGSGIGIFYNSSGSGSITERLRIRADGTFEIKGGGTAGTSPAFSVNPSASSNSLVIDSSGRCGIGESSPSYLVHAKASGSPYICVQSTSYDATSLFGATSSGSLLINQSTTLPTQIWTNGNPRLTIDSSGRCGIGTTPDVRLHVATGNATGYIKIDGGTSTNATTGLQFRSDSNAYSAEVSHYQNSLSFYTAGSEAMKIDASRRLLVGTSSARSNVYLRSDNITPPVQFEFSGSTYNSGLSLLQYSAAGYAPILTLGISQSNTPGTNTAPANGTDLGYINFVGSDGTNFRTGATIQASTDGNSGSGDLPTRLVFSTTADGASSPTERLRISSTGALTCTAGGATLAANLIATFVGGGIGLGVQIYEGTNTGASNAANAVMKIGNMATTGRSINAAGSVNVNGADYAEYMTKAGNFEITKGDVCGVTADGKLTNVFIDAISFMVKSTSPSYVGGDTWGIGFDDDPEQLEIERQKVDRIAFAGQVPVNVMLSLIHI